MMDSLQSDRQEEIDNLKLYLRDEAWSKQNVQIDVETIVGKNVKVPIQPNVIDCGVYLLKNIQYLLQESTRVTCIEYLLVSL